jgi:dTDP-4-dehydrorhamnose reductase
VFSGLKGNYIDEDIPDAVDIYGRTKGLGEVNNSTTLTIRSSMIGREMYNHTELLEWILSNKNDTIEGFKNVIYSGVTTTFMAKVVSQIILNHSQLRGIYNISSEPISKYDLALKINDLFQLNIDINPEINKESNKSLDCSKFKKDTKISIPNWDQLLFDLKNDSIKNTALYEN